MTSTIFKVRLLMFITVFSSIALLPFVDWTLTTALTAVVMYFIYGCFGIGVGNHRYWTHKGFEFRYRPLKYAATVAALLSGTGSTLSWCGLHRLHHKHSDTPNDPHQQARGLWKTLFIFYEVDAKKVIRNCIDNARDPFLRLTARYWLLIIVAWVTLLATIGINALYFVFILPSALTMLAQGVTNYVCHSQSGYAPYSDADGVNCTWLAPFVWGDTWHNNHHNNPKKSNHREKWWEVDISGMIIDVIKVK